MSAVKLYGYWRSSCAYRARICLNLKGVAYETVPVDLLAGEHKKPGYLQVNPQGKVPTLLIDGLALTQSLAIAEYLDQRSPQPRLLPAEPAAAARVRTLAFAVAMDIQPICNIGVVGHLDEIGALPRQRQQAWMQTWMSRGFDALEQLADADGPFVAGGECTLADAVLVPQLYNARRWQLDPAAWPRIARSAAQCAKLAAFEAARPELQPDASPQLRQ